MYQYMQATHASALESIEFRLAFEEPSAEARFPIADHLRDIMAICRQAGVARSAVKPVLLHLDKIHKQDEQQRSLPPPIHKPQRRCTFCDTPDTLIDEELHQVCELCGFIAETHRIQKDAWMQPQSTIHCGTPYDASTLDKTCFYQTSLDKINASIRRLCSANILAPLHSQRAMHLATLYVFELRKQSVNTKLVAASCLVYSLLETWAQLLVPVKVYRNQQWSTWWTLPTRPFAKK